MLKKRITLLLLVFTILLSGFSLNSKPAGAQLWDTVLSSYTAEYHRNYGGWRYYNQNYITIYFNNGYSYTETVEDITPLLFRLDGGIREKRTRTYRTW